MRIKRVPAILLPPYTIINTCTICKQNMSILQLLCRTAAVRRARLCRWATECPRLTNAVQQVCSIMESVCRHLFDGDSCEWWCFRNFLDHSFFISLSLCIYSLRSCIYPLQLTGALLFRFMCPHPIGFQRHYCRRCSNHF